ncbi:DNA topoisomerase 2 [Actinomortierella ambigua]|uniref:DNA topoisomerase 2 n=1 Tax=Actinomortierella ambigua TaxID=1343610 RepID=A0A9P6PPW9_9FUNG|nr:DNA topoisomerase 2 [Actinomortierella ambigua]
MSDESDYGAMSVDESDDYAPTPKTAKPKAKAKTPAPKKAAPTKEGKKPAAKKRKLSASDGDDDNDDQTESPMNGGNGDSDDDDFDGDHDDDDKKKPKGKTAAKTKISEDYEKRTIEEIYQKKTPLEHILLRPDTYIGTTEMNELQLWVLNSATQKLEYRTVNIVPGLYKIVDEILVNAADNKIRDPSMDTIKIDIDREKGLISVYNNGKGIPVEIHKGEKVYVPELIFGHLLTSSNYDDTQKKVTGGRNGYGAKLCNIFSQEFIVETADTKNGLQYKQVFSKNMSVTGKPKITPNKKNDEFTRITFRPDFARFGMTEIDDDLEALLKKRAYDLAGCVKGVKVVLNGARIKIKNFKEYINMYFPEGEEKPKIVYENPNDRWEIACVVSESGQFQHVSFVNSISTSKGGVHVDYVSNQIIKELGNMIKKKKANVKPIQIKSQMWVFINCLIENPAFDSQTKENMTLKASAFGSKCELGEKFFKDVGKSGIVDRAVSFANFKADQALKKTDGSGRKKRINVAKLEDANMAGRPGHKQNATLILTEGDSAKTLAVAGFSVVGRDFYGVFPLRGKMLNVRDSKSMEIIKNEEITNLKEILGLKHGATYKNTDDLRYGHLMIMTDQDHDGSHIKGLLINFLDHYYPSLLKIPGFLHEFITPIVKVTKGNQSHSFFTIPEYQAWSEANNTRGWKIKYYKGLGTSTTQDAKDYFSQMTRHRKQFAPLTDDDRTMVDLAFNKKKADDRKQWLAQFQPGTYLDNRVTEIPIQDFINKELILFSMADNVRSIPSVVDGLKPGQRKVMFGAFKKKIAGEIKVAQLTGYVSEQTAYHHGEQSLTMTIVGLAQTFVGSNNINLLSPNGQFGSRLAGGKDAASARYIFTAVPPISRKIFNTDDDALLTYLNDDGDWIEPEWFVPVVPMVLVNGSDGIGTGWSSSIPNYNPRDIVMNIRRLMRGEEMQEMAPWFRGFTGTIERDGPNRFKVLGKYEIFDDATVQITELPIRTWTTPYKEQLDSWVAGTEKQPAWIKDFRDDGTLSRINLTVSFAPEQLRKANANNELGKNLKLIGSISTANMVCFDPQGRIKKYASPEEIIQDFYDVRLEFYRKRKEYMTDILTREWTRLDNKVRFILMIISGELMVQNRKKAAIISDLRLHDFTPANKLDKPHGNLPQAAAPNAEENDGEGGAADGNNDGNGGSDYDYLLKMPIWSLTEEKVEQLKKEREGKHEELKILIGKSAYDLWNEDLDEFLAAWEGVLEADAVEEANMGKGNKKGVKGKGRALPVARKKAIKRGSDDEDDGDFSLTKPKKATALKIKEEAPTVDLAAVKVKPSASTSTSTSAVKKQTTLFDMMKKSTTPSVKNESMEDVIATPSSMSSAGNNDDDSSTMSTLTEVKVEPKAKTTKAKDKPKPKPRAQKKSKMDRFIDEDDEVDDDDDFAASDDDEINGEDADANMEVDIAPRRQRAARAARPTKSLYLAEGSASEESDEEDYVKISKTSSSSRRASIGSRKRTTSARDGTDNEDGTDGSGRDVAMAALTDEDEDGSFVDSKGNKTKVTTPKKQFASVMIPVSKKPAQPVFKPESKKAFNLTAGLTDDSDDGDNDFDKGKGRSGGSSSNGRTIADDSGSDFEDDQPIRKAATAASAVKPKAKVVSRKKLVSDDEDDGDDGDYGDMESSLAKSGGGPKAKKSVGSALTSNLAQLAKMDDIVESAAAKKSAATSTTKAPAAPSASAAKALSVRDKLLADLDDDLPMLMSSSKAGDKARAVTKKKPKYVDISDDD